MQKRYADLVLTASGLLVAVVLQALQHNIADTLRPFTGTLFLACVGYALYTALTLVLSEQLSIPARFAITIAVFLSVTIFIGITLNFSGWGLTRQTWLMSLAVVASIALLFSALGRMITGHSDVISLDLTGAQIGMIGLAGGLVVAAFLLAQLGVRSQPESQFSQFWMVQEENLGNNDASDTITLRIGLFNMEDMTTTYDVQLLSNRNVIDTWNTIEVAPEEKWETTLTLSSVGLIFPLEAELTIAGEDTVYRHVSFWPDEMPLYPGNGS